MAMELSISLKCRVGSRILVIFSRGIMGIDRLQRNVAEIKKTSVDPSHVMNEQITFWTHIFYIAASQSIVSNTLVEIIAKISLGISISMSNNDLDMENCESSTFRSMVRM